MARIEARVTAKGAAVAEPDDRIGRDFGQTAQMTIRCLTREGRYLLDGPVAWLAAMHSVAVASFHQKSPYYYQDISFSEPMAPDDQQAFVTSLANEHGQRLRRFLASRLRYAPNDVPDLIQEVYLRLLRIPEKDTIRSPQAYMFTIAFHVLHQYKLARAVAPEVVDPVALPVDVDGSGPDNDPATEFEVRERLGQLDQVLRELPEKAQISFLLHRQYGFTLEEIARQLGVSRAMVKKHLARAVAHCRERFEGFK